MDDGCISPYNKVKIISQSASNVPNFRKEKNILVFMKESSKCCVKYIKKNSASK
jgi:hypothetical protein